VRAPRRQPRLHDDGDIRQRQRDVSDGNGREAALEIPAESLFQRAIQHHEHALGVRMVVRREGVARRELEAERVVSLTHRVAMNDGDLHARLESGALDRLGAGGPDLPPEQHAYRAEHSALDAVRQVHGLLSTGHTEVVDADLSGYFDSIPHAELMKSVARRVSDRHLLKLIKAWLESPVEEIDERGRPHRTTRNKDEGRGSPQGSPLSPLLANIYMRRFVLGWKTLGHERRLDAHIVNDADDFVICCRGTAAEAMRVMRSLMSKLRLTVNESKTRLCCVPEQGVDFLGYTIGLCHSPRTGRSYIGTKPSAKKIASLKAEIREMTSRRWLWTTVEDRVAKLNQKLLGWSNYFCLGPVSPAYRAVDRHARHRLRQWLRGKHKLKSRGTTRFPDARLHDEFGLIRLCDRPKSFPWAKV
jgi:RNA-directed DNA polymerase